MGTNLPEIQVTESTKRVSSFSLDQEGVKELLRPLLKKAGANHGRIVNFSVSVEVPRGGDYSGMTLHIDKETPLKISWVEEDVQDSYLLSEGHLAKRDQ